MAKVFLQLGPDLDIKVCWCATCLPRTRAF